LIEVIYSLFEIATLLSTAFDSLPSKSKRAARKLFIRTKDDSRKKPKGNFYLKTILQIKEITLPVEIHQMLVACKAKPSDFWNSTAPGLDVKQITGESRCCITDSNHLSAIAQAYLDLKGLGASRKWNTIVWRFYTLFFYELAILAGNGGVNLTTIFIDRLLKILNASSIVNDDCETIKENLSKWTAAGSRYHKLCSSLGAGALFLLPQLPDNTYVIFSTLDLRVVLIEPGGRTDR